MVMPKPASQAPAKIFWPQVVSNDHPPRSETHKIRPPPPPVGDTLVGRKRSLDIGGGVWQTLPLNELLAAERKLHALTQG